MDRACGILMPVSSLPGNYGIGCFSVKAYEFIDLLKKSGQTYWQILPLGPTGYGDSPYQSFSSFAGNPYFVDLDELAAAGLLDEAELRRTDWGSDERFVDYGKLWEHRTALLRKAYEAWKARPQEGSSVSEASGKLTACLEGLDPETREYCLFKAIKKAQEHRNWMDWDDDLRLRKTAALEAFKKEHADEIRFYEWVQAVFRIQWEKLRAYADHEGVKIIGDIPIYVSPDSADAWSHPELFQFGEDGRPAKVAGCPPDYFSPDGQFWGNPLYDWDYHKKTGYAWWMHRMEYAFSLYDIVRVDHFRGFDEYYSIPADAENAKTGKWMPGPGMDIFDRMKEHFADRFETLPIIAEDLGLLTDSVIKLVNDSGFPGMKILEFSYDSDNKNLYLPHNFIRNCVAYTGTHDNEPLASWSRSLLEPVRLHMIRYQGSEHTPAADLYWDCIRTVLGSIADTVIIPMWDYLGAGHEARINLPSAPYGNWRWRMKDGELSDNLVWHCGMLSEIYARERKKPAEPAAEEKEAAEAEEKAKEA